jgi:hypothetical protein
LPVLFITNAALVIQDGFLSFYGLTLIAQLLFYALAAIGHFLQHSLGKFKALLLPYYFTFINVCVCVPGFYPHPEGQAICRVG